MTAENPTYLKYANLQIAAEAFIALKDAPPGTAASGLLTEALLTIGNSRTSRFTRVDAQWFSEDWTVVEHTSNTTTGFSGTLFRALRDDPEHGVVAGEQVISFRSTEFVDYAVRDNQATNVDAFSMTAASPVRHA